MHQVSNFTSSGIAACTGILLDLRREGIRLALISLGCITGILCIASFLVLCRPLPFFLRLLHVATHRSAMRESYEVAPLRSGSVFV